MSVVFKYNRKHDRKEYSPKITFSDGLGIYDAELNDVSFGGASFTINSSTKLKNGILLLISIPFALKNEILYKKAKVRWVKENKVGVNFV